MAAYKRTAKVCIPALLLLLCFANRANCSGNRFESFGMLVKKVKDAREDATSEWKQSAYIADQKGLMEADKIAKLPGQPDGVDFDQYAGYVTVDHKTGRALFYYFAQAPGDSASKPLVLWLNGGPGCSSLGYGAMTELGPFRVNKDGTTLSTNPYAWNKEANIIFLESPAGVGFSYSNTTSDYNHSGDKRTAQDSYTFLANWLERFPQYKNRDFYITGESYAGHYVPQLAYTILINNNSNHTTTINLRGIAIGNAWIDYETNTRGTYDFFWTHALIPDEVYNNIIMNCNFSAAANETSVCEGYQILAYESIGDIDVYNIYAPLCNLSSPTTTFGGFDPCSDTYVQKYLNTPQVQAALHANVTHLSYPWVQCSDNISFLWTDSPATVLPTIKRLMDADIRVWIYSGDIDSVVPVTATKYSIDTFKLSLNTSWYPWYSEGEVGGYAVKYQTLTFVTIRDAGHFVPSYQPARALTFFSSFLEGTLPPSS